MAPFRVKWTKCAEFRSFGEGRSGAVLVHRSTGSAFLSARVLDEHRVPEPHAVPSLVQ